jgi:putative nucleotidyltransferase with HDIG domain
MKQQFENISTSGKKIELILQQLNGLPTLPAIAAKLMQITTQSTTHADEVIELIESDPALSTKIISLTSKMSKDVNRMVASSVGQAVKMIGFDAVRNAVLSIKVFETLGGNDEGCTEGFDRVEFWKHCLAVACASKQIIQIIDPNADSEEAFLCGLLHDMGKVALDTCLPKSFAKVVHLAQNTVGNISEIELKVLGIDHSVAGKRIAENWGLPTSIIETVWLHHQNPQALPEMIKNKSIVQAVHLADLVVRQQRLGFSGNYCFNNSIDFVGVPLGCSEKALEKIGRNLRNEVSDRGFLLGLDDLDSDDLYQEALGDANSELGRLNEKLQFQNKKLHMRSKYFDLLSVLGECVTESKSVTNLCGSIAKVWGAHFSAKHVAIYTINKQLGIFEGSVSRINDNAHEAFIVDRVDSELFDGNFTIGLTDQSQAWFFEEVDVSFDSRETYMIPFAIGGQLIGRLLWQHEGATVNYKYQFKEIEAFASAVGLALSQEIKHQDLKSMCEQLAQSNRLLSEAQLELVNKRSFASVGEMACGAAHEINNPLAVIVGRAELLASTEGDDKKKVTLESIATSGKTITDIISELLAFAVPDKPKPKANKLKTIIEKGVNSRSHEIEANEIGIEYIFDKTLPDLYIDGNQIVVAIGEVISNAINAYGGVVGNIIISVNHDEMNDEMVIKIKDFGCGMNNEAQDKAFIPFYSGKEAGRNRGLGLSRSLRSIEANGGRVLINSNPGEGTTVRIFLPIVVTNATVLAV